MKVALYFSCNLHVVVAEGKYSIYLLHHIDQKLLFKHSLQYIFKSLLDSFVVVVFGTYNLNTFLLISKLRDFQDFKEVEQNF